MKPYVGAIIQARLTSSRLPRKHLLQINGIPLLEHLVNRVHASIVDKVVIAAPHNPECCLNEEIFIGSENDVLDRYYQASKKYCFDYVVRITGDCALLPPSEINRVVRHCTENNLQYVSNVRPKGRFGVPDGWDVECFSFQALENAWLKATESYDREHVTSIMRHGAGFYPVYLDPPKLSVDTQEDYDRLKEFYELEAAQYKPTNTTETQWTGQMHAS